MQHPFVGASASARCHHRNVNDESAASRRTHVPLPRRRGDRGSHGELAHQPSRDRSLNPSTEVHLGSSSAISMLALLLVTFILGFLGIAYICGDGLFRGVSAMRARFLIAAVAVLSFTAWFLTYITVREREREYRETLRETFLAVEAAIRSNHSAEAAGILEEQSDALDLLDVSGGNWRPIHDKTMAKLAPLGANK